MSAEFMQDLIQYLKDGKKLHRKYAFKVNVGGIRGGVCQCGEYVRGGVCLWVSGGGCVMVRGVSFLCHDIFSGMVGPCVWVEWKWQHSRNNSARLIWK